MLTSTRRLRSADDDPTCVRTRLESLFRRAAPATGDPPGTPDSPDESGVPSRPATHGGRSASGSPGPAGPAPAGADRGVGLLTGSLAGRWPNARIDPGRRGILALLAVALAVAVLVGALVWRARPAVEPAPTSLVARSDPTAPTGRTGPTNSDPAPTATPGDRIVVAVVGRVRHPGIVTLTRGARVIDAIRAAGGLSPGADPGLLNLARRLGDGEQVVVDVPTPGAMVAAGSEVRGAQPDGAASGGMVNLNTATAAELVALPGIGPVTAQRILDWRSAHGQFTSVAQLGQVSGIGPAKLAQIRGRVTV